MASNKPVEVSADGSTYTVQHSMNDDAYLEQIAQYKDKPYYEYLLNNPWMYSKQGDYVPNFFQRIGEDWFNDYTARNNYYSSILSNQNEWLSEALERFRQEDYNSPIQQVARQRAAGLNPDLNGNVDSGSAAENDQPILGNPHFPESNSLKMASDFFMNIYSFASGFAKDFLSLEQLANGVAAGDVDIADKIVSATNDYIKGRSWLGSVETEDGSSEYSFNVNTDDLDDYAKSLFRSRSQRKRFVNEVQKSIISSRGRFATFGSIKDAQDAKRALAESIGQNEAYGNNEFDPMIIVYKNLHTAQREITELQQNYTSDYFHEANGKTAAQAENSTNEGVIENNKALSYQRRLDAIINRTMEKIARDLEQSANSSTGIEKFLSKGMLMYLSAYRLNLVPSLPQVNLKGLVDNRTMIFGDSK